MAVAYRAKLDQQLGVASLNLMIAGCELDLFLVDISGLSIPEKLTKADSLEKRDGTLVI